MTAVTRDDELYLKTVEEVCLLLQDEDSPVLDWFNKLGQSILDVDYFTLMEFTDVKERQSVNFPLLPRLLHLLRECLLNHRWTEALEVFHKLTPIPNGSCRTLWKVGTELLARDGAENSDLMIQHYNLIKFVKELNSKEVGMDLMTYLLSIGENNDALDKMQERVPKRHKVKITEHSIYIDKLHKAYMGLLWYMEWKKTCQAVQTAQHTLQQDQYSSQNPAASEIQSLNMQKSSFWTKAVKCFEEIQEHPGIWDIFVRRHVELHLNEGGTEAALKVLREYCEVNPDNVNTHIYLYKFYQQHLPDNKDKMKQLEIIAVLSPSDKLVLEYCQQLMKDDVYSACKYLVKLLDYSCWQYEVKPWNIFAKILHQIKVVRAGKHKSKAAEFDKCMENRQSWWPAYHFSIYTAQQGINIPNLNLNKACVASTLYGNDCQFVVEVENQLSKSEKKILMKYLKEDKT